MSRHENAFRSGSVLVIVLFISGAVAILGTGMFAVGHHARVQAVNTAQEMAAGVAADAGLTRAVHTLLSQYGDGSLDPDALPSQADADLPNFDGTFTYTVTANPSGGYTVTSVGRYQTATKTVEGIVRSTGVNHEYAVFVQENLTLNNSARIDRYNHQPGDPPLKIGTNSTGTGKITLHNSAFVNGDIMIGAGGDPDDVISGGANQYAEAYPLPASRPMPSAAVPDYLASSATKGAITGNLTVTTSGKYDRINLGNSKKLTIQGDVELYITGTLTLGNSAEIRIESGSSLVLYIDGGIQGNNSSKFNNLTQDPRRLKIMGTDSCTTVTLNNSGQMYSIIYTPNAQLVLHNSATVRGSVTARTCVLHNSAMFYYDASLRDDPDPCLGEMKLASWREY